MEFSENTFVSDHFWNHPQYRPLLLGTIGMLLLVMSYLVLPEDVVSHLQKLASLGDTSSATSFFSTASVASAASAASTLSEAATSTLSEAADIVIDLKAPF